MEYMFLINVDETQGPPGDPSDDGFDELMAGWFAYNKMLTEGGHFVAGASLQPSTTATVLHNETGAVTDGPYTETKEQIGGFYVVRAENLDEALALAGKMPAQGAIEVRPIMFRPDA